jgi:putative heme degradation protein
MMRPSVGGPRVTLAPDWHALIEAMAALGPLQLWVGNAGATIVRRLVAPQVTVRASHIDLVADGLHARLELASCATAFAAETGQASATPLVLSIHDHLGTVAMELRFSERVRPGFETLVRAYRQGGRAHDAPSDRVPEASARPNDDFDVQAVRAAWDELGEHRSMFDLLEHFDISFAQCCRLVGATRARRTSAAMAHARLIAAHEQHLPTIVRIHNDAASAAHVGTLCATRTAGSIVHLYACCGFGASIALPGLVSGWEVIRPGVDRPSRSIEFVDATDARVLSVAFPRAAHLDYL